MTDPKPSTEKYDDHFKELIDGTHFYLSIAQPVKDLADADPNILDSDCFKTIEKLFAPLILIWNWKSQAPFPVDIATVIRRLIDLARLPNTDPRSEEFRRIFKDLIGVEGFQLPTVSKYFHFLHPDRFPIVDRNVEAACGELDGSSEPRVRLPHDNESADQKYDAYLAFIERIKAIIHVQQEIQRKGSAQCPDDENDLRFAVEGLMILGKIVLRNRESKASS